MEYEHLVWWDQLNTHQKECAIYLLNQKGKREWTVADINHPGKIFMVYSVLQYEAEEIKEKLKNTHAGWGLEDIINFLLQ